MFMESKTDCGYKAWIIYQQIYLIKVQRQMYIMVEMVKRYTSYEIRSHWVEIKNQTVKFIWPERPETFLKRQFKKIPVQKEQSTNNLCS